MAFLDLRLPVTVSYGAVGGAGWSTRVVDTDGGHTYLQPVWAAARGRWTISHEFRSPSEWAALIALHRIVRGRLHGFRFQDWSDYLVTTLGITSVYEINSTTRQMYKNYRVTDEATGEYRDNIRTITKPQPGTILFWEDATPMDPQPAIDYTTGIVTLPPPAGGSAYYWTGQFDVPVRFETDRPELFYDDYNIVSWRGIEIVELSQDELA